MTYTLRREGFAGHNVPALQAHRHIKNWHSALSRLHLTGLNFLLCACFLLCFLFLFSFYPKFKDKESNTMQSQFQTEHEVLRDNICFI